jgi:hypothetical protein
MFPSFVLGSGQILFSIPQIGAYQLDISLRANQSLYISESDRPILHGHTNPFLSTQL